MRKLTTKTAAAVAGTALALTASGVAFAFWTGTGTGTGTAATSTGHADLRSTQTTVLGDIYPGRAPQTISGKVKNHGDETTYVTKVTASISGVSGGAGSCDASDYTLTDEVMTVGADLAKDAEATFTGAKISFNNKATSQDGCKGATVTLTYAVS
jgi:hypothetical protein